MDSMTGYYFFGALALAFHIYTVIIGFTQGGLLGGILTLLFPFVASIYWMIVMWGRDPVYSLLAIIYLIGALTWGAWYWGWR